MTIATARKKFETLKEQILKDGKIDYTETEVLLDFIEPYVKAHNRKFAEFARIIHQCQEDGKIDDTESKFLTEVIDDMSNFLKLEARIEKILSIFAFSIICVLIAVKLFS